MLVLNMLTFNFTDGWNRTFSKHQYARFYLRLMVRLRIAAATRGAAMREGAKGWT